MSSIIGYHPIPPDLTPRGAHMGHKAKRPIGRPRKAALPDPTDPALRRWVIGLTPERMYREVCARLRGRTDLEREAFAVWAFAGFPGWPEGQAEVPLSLRLRLAERLTITSPLVSLGYSRIPLLPFGTLVNEWWQPVHRAGDLLAEYERLHLALRRFRPAQGRLWSFLERRAGTDRCVRLAEILYPLPSPTSCTRDPAPEPARAAETLLSNRHATNARQIHTGLARAREEREIMKAWQQHGQWLLHHPTAGAELEAVLTVCTRDGGSSSHRLSSPSDPDPRTPRAS